MKKEVMNDILLCLFLFTVVVAIVDVVQVCTGNYPFQLLPINIGCACICFVSWRNHKRENNL